MDKSLVPDRFKPWVLLFWTGAAVYAIASAKTFLMGLSNVGVTTLLLAGAVIFAEYIRMENTQNPLLDISKRLENIEKKLK